MMTNIEQGCTQIFISHLLTRSQAIAERFYPIDTLYLVHRAHGEAHNYVLNEEKSHNRRMGWKCYFLQSNCFGHVLYPGAMFDGP